MSGVPILVTLPSVPHTVQFDFFSLEVVLAAMNKKIRPPVVPGVPTVTRDWSKNPSPPCTWNVAPAFLWDPSESWEQLSPVRACV